MSFKTKFQVFVKLGDHLILNYKKNIFLKHHNNQLKRSYNNNNNNITNENHRDKRDPNVQPTKRWRSFQCQFL